MISGATVLEFLHMFKRSNMGVSVVKMLGSPFSWTTGSNARRDGHTIWSAFLPLERVVQTNATAWKYTLPMYEGPEPMLMFPSYFMEQLKMPAVMSLCSQTPPTTLSVATWMSFHSIWRHTSPYVISTISSTHTHDTTLKYSKLLASIFEFAAFSYTYACWNCLN